MPKAKTAVEDVVTADDVLGELTPATLSVVICTRGDLTEEIQRLERDLIDAESADRMSNEPPTAPAITARIGELEEQARAHEREFVLTALSRKAWSDLKAQHKPTAEQRKEAPGVDRNHETFWPAALAACLTRPTGFTPEKVALLAERLSSGGWDRLVGACHSVNEGAQRAPFSQVASVMRQRSSGNSDSPAS